MKVLRARTGIAFAAAVASLATPAWGQWDPENAQWGKSDPTDVRVMTWNVEDGICSSNPKLEGLNNWTALARIVAAMKPDLLVLQEVGDNSGNGTGAGVDSIADLEFTVDLFLHGGLDPFRSNEAVTAWVQKYDPDFDLPFVFVGARNDGFNRNVILSRFPFVDLNGDGKGRYDDIPFVFSDAYAPGGNGGIRGFQFAEIDLPDNVYRGDLVIGNAHLKAGGSSSDKADRLKAAQNVAYVIDYWYNGADAGIPDPNNKILDSPAATHILADDTPIILGGDWNEDEQSNGRRGPADWLTRAQITGGADGTDRDRTDMLFDAAVHVFSGSRATQSSSKLDYIGWQDSITDSRREFVFNTSGTPSDAMPPEIQGFPIPSIASGTASDHRPVIADLILPLRTGPGATEIEINGRRQPVGVQRINP